MCELVLRVYDVSTFTPAAVKSKVLVPLHKYEKHGWNRACIIIKKISMGKRFRR